ncbi:MAG: hypothetical protein HOP07_17770 [Bacteriovoracaceae bacterium]|nr:hypothetical protein [Bacteriovoracaceae bacterium]
MSKKINDFGLVGDIYSAYESVYPSKNLETLVAFSFNKLDLALLYTDLNYQLNKVKKDHFEIELKETLGKIMRISYTIFRRIIRNKEMRNAIFYFEDKGLDITRRANYKDKNFITKLKDSIQEIEGNLEKGRPRDYVLRSVITEINDHLKYYCQTELRLHAVDSGNAYHSEERFSGAGLALVLYILEDFKITYHSKRTIFDLIKYT